jgi:3-hydroxyisobutyrate dehydrogenase-like beta-hydroxyacid dehydrogenase
MNIGLLNPGAMGVSVGASAKAGAHRVLWASQGRGAATKARAAEHGLEDVGTVAELCAVSEIILSVCPPAAAEDVAQAVAAAAFKGIFVDCNAISPARMGRVQQMVEEGGARAVDGGIIGPPAWKAGVTTIHLSGPEREAVARCFEKGLLDALIMSDKIGEASALKMCYAAFTKGQAALLAAILATSHELGVRDALNARWEADGVGTVASREAIVEGVTGKAWRWVDELEEIARTFAESGQPVGFHLASAEIYRRLADLKGTPQPVAISEIVAKLNKN